MVSRLVEIFTGKPSSDSLLPERAEEVVGGRIYRGSDRDAG